MKTTILQRLAYRLINDRRYYYFSQFSKHLRLTRQQILQLQNKYLQRLIEHAYAHTEYYRHLFNSLNIKPGDIRTCQDLKKLPPLTKSIIRNNLEKLRSNDNYAKKMVKITSGGSTGNEAVIYKSRYFIAVTRGVELRNFLLANWHPGDKSAWIWGSPIEHGRVGGFAPKKLGLFINKRIILNAFNYSEDQFSIWVNTIKKHRPKIIYGYGGILLDFSKYLLNNQIQLDNINSVISTSEQLSEKDTIATAFNAPVYDQYGCREILGVGIESTSGNMLIADDNVCIHSTENHSLLITALHSLGFPLINYQVGDTGTKLDNIDEQDSPPFSKMSLQVGRETDNFITSQQSYVSSSSLATYISTFNLGIKKYQIIQADYKIFTVNFIPDACFDLNRFQNVVEQVLEEYFGTFLLITFNRVDNIKIEPSGKTRLFKRTFNIN